MMSLLETTPRFKYNNHIQSLVSVGALVRHCDFLAILSTRNTLVTTEDLVVGDERGDLYYS